MICDLVETGTTLRENNLVVLSEVVPISARFICNPVAWQFRHEEIGRMKQALEERIGKGE